MSYISFDLWGIFRCLTEIKKRVIIKVNFRKGEWFIMCKRNFLAIAIAPNNVKVRCIARSVIINHSSFEV